MDSSGASVFGYGQNTWRASGIYPDSSVSKLGSSELPRPSSVAQSLKVSVLHVLGPAIKVRKEESALSHHLFTGALVTASG